MIAASAAAVGQPTKIPSMKQLSPLLFLLALNPALAQEQTHACASILQPAERLACYDQAFGAPHAAEQSAASMEEAREQFGLDQREKRERTPEPLRLPEVDEIEGAITDLSTDGRGGRVLTLDNGQVWRITENTSKGPLRIGDVVRVNKGAFGSHNLVTPGGIGLKVRRVK